MALNIDWDHYVFTENGIAGYSDKINEAACFGRDDNHLSVSDGLYPTCWAEILWLEKYIEDKKLAEDPKYASLQIKQSKSDLESSNRKNDEFDPSKYDGHLSEDDDESEPRDIIQRKLNRTLALVKYIREIFDPKVYPYPLPSLEDNEVIIAGTKYMIQDICFDKFDGPVRKSKVKPGAKNKNLENSKMEKDEGITAGLDEEAVAGAKQPIQSETNSAGKTLRQNYQGLWMTAVESKKDRPKQKQFAMYRTNSVYLMAIAGGNNETDCDVQTPLTAVKAVGRYLVMNDM